MSDGFLQYTNATGTTTAVATLNGVTAGSTIVAFLWDGNNSAPSTHSVADAQGTYTARGSSAADVTDGVWMQIYVLENANAGTHTITGTLDSGATAEIHVVETSAATVSAFIDAQTLFQNSPGTGTDAVKPATLTIATAATLIAMSSATNVVNAGDEPNVGTGFTSRGNGTSTTIGSYRVETKAVSANADGSFTAPVGTDLFITGAIAIKNGVAAAASPRPPQQITLGPGGVPMGATPMATPSQATSYGAVRWQNWESYPWSPFVPPAAYNPGTDVLRVNKQATVFSAPETFAQQQKTYLWPPYVAGVDVTRTYKQAYAWSSPETFYRPVPFNQLIINGTGAPTYNPATDVLRINKQAVAFVGPEAFLQAQKSYVWPPYVPGNDLPRTTKSAVFGQYETFPQPWRGAPLITNGRAAEIFDLFSSQEIFGWGDQTSPWSPSAPASIIRLTQYVTYDPSAEPRQPQAKVFGQPETFYRPQSGYPFAVFAPYVVGNDPSQWRGQAKVFGTPETFLQPWSAALVVTLTPYAAYDPTVEPRRAQDKTFGQPETFSKPQNAYPFAVFAPYVPGADPTLFRPQARTFIPPEVFAQPSPSSLVTVLTPYVPYDPTTDVRRALQALVFGSVEVFPQAAPFSQVLINGTAAPPDVIQPPTPSTGQVPGFVAGKPAGKRKRRKDGPTMREDQVFGEQYPVSPFATSALKPGTHEAQTRKSRRAAVIAAMMKELL